MMKKELQLHVWNSDAIFEYEDGNLTLKAVAYIGGSTRNLWLDSQISFPAINEKDIDSIIDFLHECKKDFKVAAEADAKEEAEDAARAKELEKSGQA